MNCILFKLKPLILFHHCNIIIKYNKYQMETEDDHHNEILSQMKNSPHLLNELTQKYLTYLTTSSYAPNTASWQFIQDMFKTANSKDTTIQQFILLFHATGLVLSETIGKLNGINENRMYCWMSMLYGVKCSQIIQQIQNIIKELPQNQEDKRIIFKYVCYGLLMSEIMLSTVEKTNKSDTSNRVIYPQFYRLAEMLIKYLIKHENPNLNTSLAQHKANETNFEQQKISHATIKTTDILKMLHQKQNKNKSKKPDIVQKLYSKVAALIIGKIIQLLDRSFAIVKIKQVRKIHIIKDLINQQLKEAIAGEGEEQQQNQRVKDLIKQYLVKFEPKVQTEEDQKEPVQQIDEDNKIIEVRELTPRFIDERPVMELKKLRTKKKKLIKKIQSDARRATLNRLQQHKVIQEVRSERAAKRQKKQIFIMQKQTEQAKKQHNKMKRIKQIQKEGKAGKGGKNKTSKSAK